jgi:hypothetical protein
LPGPNDLPASRHLDPFGGLVGDRFDYLLRLRPKTQRAEPAAAPVAGNSER